MLPFSPEVSSLPTVVVETCDRSSCHHGTKLPLHLPPLRPAADKHESPTHQEFAYLLAYGWTSPKKRKFLPEMPHKHKMAPSVHTYDDHMASDHVPSEAPKRQKQWYSSDDCRHTQTRHNPDWHIQAYTPKAANKSKLDTPETQGDTANHCTHSQCSHANTRHRKVTCSDMACNTMLLQQ